MYSYRNLLMLLPDEEEPAPPLPPPEVFWEAAAPPRPRLDGRNLIMGRDLVLDAFFLCLVD